MQEIISKMKNEVIKRSNQFETIAKGTKDESTYIKNIYNMSTNML